VVFRDAGVHLLLPDLVVGSVLPSEVEFNYLSSVFGFYKLRKQVKVFPKFAYSGFKYGNFPR
jgi:hypothetical protein